MSARQVYQTETRTQGAMSFRVEWVHDTDHGAPWIEEDGHGPVSDWETRSKRPGEMILCSDRRARRFYDFAEAVRIARRDGWGAPGEHLTDGARAHAAAMADFEWLRRWCAGDWHYCGIVVTLLDADGEPDSIDASLWAIEDDGRASASYHDEIVGDLIAECTSQIKFTIGV